MRVLLALLVVVGMVGSSTESEAAEPLTLKRYSGPVTSVSFSPDGKRIVAVRQNSPLKVWDAQTGQETLTLKRHSGSVLSVSFSPDGKRIVSGSWDSSDSNGLAVVYNRRTGEWFTLRGGGTRQPGESFSDFEATPASRQLVQTDQ